MNHAVAVKDPFEIVSACDVLESIFYDEEREAKTVWGVRITFSGGTTTEIPDLSTHRCDAERLARRLVNQSLAPDFLPDVLDDFLAELYGIHFDVKSQLEAC